MGIKLSSLSNGVSEVSAITNFSTSFNSTTSKLILHFYSNENKNVQLLGFNEKLIDGGEHDSGIYLVRLISENGAVTKKIVIR